MLKVGAPYFYQKKGLTVAIFTCCFQQCKRYTCYTGLCVDCFHGFLWRDQSVWFSSMFSRHWFALNSYWVVGLFRDGFMSYIYVCHSDLSPRQDTGRMHHVGLHHSAQVPTPHTDTWAAVFQTCVSLLPIILYAQKMPSFQDVHQCCNLFWVVQFFYPPAVPLWFLLWWSYWGSKIDPKKHHNAGGDPTLL